MSLISLVHNFCWWSLILTVGIAGTVAVARPVRAEQALSSLLLRGTWLGFEILPQLYNQEPIGLPEGLVLRVEPKVQTNEPVVAVPQPAFVTPKPRSVVVAPESGQAITPRSIRSAPTDLEHWFGLYGQAYRVDPKTLQAIAQCESGFNSGASNGPYGGLYQFHSGTWQTNRTAMGLDTNPQLRFQPEEAVKTAAFKISRDGTAAWPVCRSL